jgi:signal transduction histidine kinase
MNYNISNELINYSHSVRVLFVEDEVCSVNNSVEMLGIFFSNIDIVRNTAEAYEHFLEKKYDLLITGLNFSTKSGLKFISKVREISKDVTILVISSHSDKFDFSELIKLGVDGYIIRPVQISQFNDVISKTIEKLKNKQDLYEYRINLENKVQQQVEILRQKDEVLAYQSKLAAMGEMMDAVAHQWKQPINIINMKIDMLRYDFEDGNVDQNYCDELYNSIIFQTSHMKNTLSEFRTFLRPDKQKEKFSLSKVIDSVLLLVHDELLKYNINIEKNIKDNFIIEGTENEFKHLLLNLISNSKDAFLEKDIKSRKIAFNLFEKNEKIYLEFIDNAGGIPEDILQNIFNANFTTKDAEKGSGIGLYMSKQIAKKHKALLKVENYQSGVKFIVEF